MANKLCDILSELDGVDKMLTAIKSGKHPFNVTGVSESQKAHLIATLCEKSNKRAIVVTNSESQAMRLNDDINFFLCNSVYIPPGELNFYKVEASQHAEEYNKTVALKNFEEKKLGVVSVDTFLRFVVEKNKINSKDLSIKVGKRLDIENLSSTLCDMGYKREHTVESRGQFSIRGGIVDIFSIDAPNPIRIEFFGDEVDSVRIFDAETQRSEKTIKDISVIPAKPGEESSNILSYISENDLVILDEPSRIKERAKTIETEVYRTVSDLLEKNIISEKKDKYINSYEDMLKEALKRCLIGIFSINRSAEDYKEKAVYNITVKTNASYNGNTELLLEDVNRWIDDGYKIAIAGGDRSKSKRIEELLRKNDIKAKIQERDSFTNGEIAIYEGVLKKGFEYPIEKIVFLSDSDILQGRIKKKTKKTKKNIINNVDDLTVGDFVVHDTHGIGKYLGIVRLTVSEVNRDYIKLEYRGGEFLYLPVGQLESITKYIGGEIKSIRLSKLGGTEWSGVKRRVKESVKDFADKLISLYAEREKSEGHAFSKDSIWQRQFEDEFEYEETEDQIKCINEMKRDMEKTRPMDRLLCGDVGFGKTEVAMRGAFKAVLDGYQVAYLVPTTVLASQHYNNFTERMKNFPVTVKMLSRFCTPKEVKTTLEMLQTGECDIVVGTHKLLGDKVKFKKLGLLIVDEEQRFGVSHKEKIKEIKKNVDVLTLSATPIPRTLHMAMVGIRDMSLIQTPPENRFPVQTYVIEYNEDVVINAIERELSRGGQVYYLCNNIKALPSIALRLKEKLPDRNIVYAHGRMGESALEKVMIEFQEGNIDVLVCTTIIETGMDIQNANTLIIENADNLGLSQLYQLRGRVGRTDKMAYAYLTFKPNKELDEISEKRLRAIKDFTEFGSGFKIAMRDLELRGAGDVLGMSQHGFMATVGYDMYCRILEETINEAMGKPTEEKKNNVSIDLLISAYIPENYVPSSDLRMELYRKIATIQENEDAKDILGEIKDRYGEVPKEVERLISVSLLKKDCREAGIFEITQNDVGISFKIDKNNPPDSDKISKLASKFKGGILYGAGEKPYILLRNKAIQNQDVIFIVNIVLQCLKKEKK